MKTGDFYVVHRSFQKLEISYIIIAHISIQKNQLDN